MCSLVLSETPFLNSTLRPVNGSSPLGSILCFILPRVWVNIAFFEVLFEVEGECNDERSSPYPHLSTSYQKDGDNQNVFLERQNHQIYVIDKEKELVSNDLLNSVVYKEEILYDTQEYGNPKSRFIDEVDSCEVKQEEINHQIPVMIKAELVNDFQKDKKERTNEDREEGEASDSGEDGEVMSETKIKDEIENDQEEGEIFEEVLVKVEFNENTSKEADDLAHQVKEELKDSEEEDSTEEEGEDDFSEDDVEDQRFRGSYMLGQFLKELLNKEFDRRCEKQRKKDEVIQKKLDEKRRKTRIRGGESSSSSEDSDSDVICPDSRAIMLENDSESPPPIPH